MDSYIYYVFILKNLFQNLFGTHYPTEIIRLIVLTLYKPIQIVAGEDYTILISDTPYVWGGNNYGQLGLGDHTNRNSPHRLLLHQIKSVSCGAYHTVALSEHDILYVWGCNINGELGLGDNINRYSPTELRFYFENQNRLSQLQSIVCGGFHTIVLTFSSKIYVWGTNWAGQLGLGDTKSRNTPQELVLNNIMSIGCGGNHTVALSHHNDIYIWGHNKRGQLGLGDYDNRCLPQKLNFSLPNIKSIGCGGDYTIVLTSLGFLYSWGQNICGQLGLGDKNRRNIPHEIKLSNVKSINCGWNHAVAMVVNSEKSSSISSGAIIYGWGRNCYDQLEDAIDQILPQKLILENIMAIVCGGYHKIAITKNNDIYAWGTNENGQLGLEDHTGRKLPCKLNFKF